MYGSILYGSALYGSRDRSLSPFYIGKSSADYAGLPYALQMYVDATGAEVTASASGVYIIPTMAVFGSKGVYDSYPIGIEAYNSAPWDLALAETALKGNPISYQGYFDLNPSTAKFEGNSVVWNTLFDIPVTQSYADGHGFEWQLYYDPRKSEVVFEGNPFSSLTKLDYARSYADLSGRKFDWLLYFDPVKAKPKATGGIVAYIASGTAYFDLYVSEAFFRGIEIDPEYVPITAVPNLVAQRVGNGDNVSLDVLNPINTLIEITRTDGYLGNQSPLTTIPVNTLPYTDSVDIEGNYRYMATYALFGEKGGVPVTLRSQPSGPRLTFGKNRTL